MAQQKRPLTGMILANSPATPPVVIGTPYVIHQVDASSPTNFLDNVTLFLRNTDATTAATITVTVCGGTAMPVLVPVNSAVAVFVEQPIFGVPGQPTQSQIVLNNTTVYEQEANPVFAFGHFTR